MLVVVIGVLGVTVSVVNEVHVVVVLDRLVSALSTVCVLVDGVLGDALMLVVVALVQGVVMRAVNVVSVVSVLDRGVPAVGAVLVLGDGVFRVNFRDAHGVPFDDAIWWRGHSRGRAEPV